MLSGSPFLPGFPATSHFVLACAQVRDDFGKDPVPQAGVIGCQAGVFSEVLVLHEPFVQPWKVVLRRSREEMVGDVVIDVPPDSQVHKQVVRKRAEVHDIEVNPLVRLYLIEVPEPNMHDPSGDLERVCQELEFEWGLTDLKCDLHVYPALQESLRKGEWRITVAVFRQREIIALWPGFRDQALGIAVDIGSTTIAAHLCDLSSGKVLASSGMMNPQIRFGEDLMSRVSYVMMHPGGEKELTEVVRSAVLQLSREVCTESGYEPSDVLDMTFVGNPIMHHLLLGVSPVELGGAPFALATDQALELKASDLGLEMHPGTRAYLLPCIAGHVGADAAAMVLSEAPILGRK